MKKTLSLLPFLLLFNVIFVDAQFTFIKGLSAFLGNYIQQTSDGGYIMAGSGAGFNGQSDLLLVKTDASGDTMWTKVYGSAGDDLSYEVRQTPDGGYILIGTSTPYISISGYQNIIVVKTDPRGDTLWTRIYDGPGDDYGTSIQLLDDGGYFISSNNDDDFLLMKIDSLGSVLWTRFYNSAASTDWQLIRSCSKTTDGGYILVGQENYGMTNEIKVLLIKTDSVGNLAWNRTYGTNGWHFCYSVEQTIDGGYILGAAKLSFVLPANPENFYLLKTDSLGNLLWNKTYGGDSSGTDMCYSVHQTTDRGYMMAGLSTTLGNILGAYLVKTNEFGDTLWTRIFGGSFAGSTVHAVQAMDGGYALLADIGIFGASPSFLIKTNSTGNSNCYEFTPPTIVRDFNLLSTPYTFIPITAGVTEKNIGLGVSSLNNNISTLCFDGLNEAAAADDPVSVYPNPSTSSFVVHFSKPMNAELLIYDLQGRLIQKMKITGDEIKFEKHDLSTGSYFIVIRDNEKQYIKRIVIE